MNRQSWSNDEDQAIIKLVQEYGIDDWTKIAFKLRERLGVNKRTGKQCRERWYNHLSPSVNKLPWTDEEEELLFIHHKTYGNRWKDISKLFIGRTDNDIKNHFYSTLRRSLRRLNKVIGQKNSTTQMRQIKPSVLSTIMNFIYDQEHSSIELVQSLKDLPILIFQFAKFKPIKINIKNANIQNIKLQTNQIFTLITRFNQEYEQNKEFRRCLKSQRRLKKLSLNRVNSEQPSQSAKFEQEQLLSEQIMIKQEFMESEHACIKIEECFQDRDHHPDHKNIQKTEFSINPCHFDSYHNQETPLGLMQHMVSSPKVTIRQAHIQYPSHHRTFSLEADQLHDLHFNEPEEPSKIDIEQNLQFHLSDQPEQKQRDARQLELIDEVIQTRYNR